MKRFLLIATILLTFGAAKGQTTFSDMTDVITFMKDKTYYNSDLDIEIEFGFISSYNTYGIKLKSNKNGNVLYYINCDIEANGSYADISGISSTDGGNFRFRLYKTKLIVGIGEEKQATFYPKED